MDDIMLLLFFVPGAVSLILFLLCYFINPARIVNGFLFNCFFISTGAGIAVALLKLDNQFATLLIVAVFLVVMAVFAFGIYILIALLFLNARIIAKRERFSIANALTLILGIALVLLLVAVTVISKTGLPEWLMCLWLGILCSLSYHVVHVVNFLSSFFLMSLYKPRKNKEFIIVLGSGLVEGKVTPLLGGRIDKAISFYHAQKKTGKPPKLIMSGGQGEDEPMAEAEAMKNYAVEKGIPETHIIVEDKSRNTLENMRFSKQKIPYADKLKRTIYSTSNYHLLRAGMYAKAAGLRPVGIGAKTALYYLPNALIREYIALVAMKKRRYLIVTGLCFLAGVLAGGAIWFINYYTASLQAVG